MMTDDKQNTSRQPTGSVQSQPGQGNENPGSSHQADKEQGQRGSQMPKKDAQNTDRDQKEQKTGTR